MTSDPLNGKRPPREIGAGAFCGDSVPVLHQVFHQGHEPGLVFLPVGKELQGIALLLDEAADGDIPGNTSFLYQTPSLPGWCLTKIPRGAAGVYGRTG